MTQKLSIKYTRPNYEQIKADKNRQENETPRKESLKAEPYHMGLKQCGFNCGKEFIQKIYEDKEINEIISDICDNCGSENFRSEPIQKTPEPTTKPIEILSFGVGKDSVTELLLNGHRYDEIIFSDTVAMILIS